MSQVVRNNLENDIKAQIVFQLREKKAYDRNDSKLLELIEKQASERAAHLYRQFVLTCENAVSYIDVCYIDVIYINALND